MGYGVICENCGYSGISRVTILPSLPVHFHLKDRCDCCRQDNSRS